MLTGCARPRASQHWLEQFPSRRFSFLIQAMITASGCVSPSRQLLIRSRTTSIFKLNFSHSLCNRWNVRISNGSDAVPVWRTSVKRRAWKRLLTWCRVRGLNGSDANRIQFLFELKHFNISWIISFVFQRALTIYHRRSGRYFNPKHISK